MEVSRRFVSAAPPATTFADSKPTLIVSWWCTIYAIIFILFRVSGRYIRTEKLFTEDKVVYAGIILLLIRMALAHVVLLYGTNNVISTCLDTEDIRHREIASQLVLVSRIIYPTYLWILKYSISIYLHKLTSQFWQKSHNKRLRFLQFFLGITYIGVIISDLTECQPFNHYWQVAPDPGPKCRQAYGQLFTMGITSAITDVILVLVPIPMLLKSRLSPKRKLKTITILSLPLLSPIFNVYRVSTVIDHQGDQNVRTLMASIDVLIATIAVNAVVLSSLMQDKGYKKLKYKHDLGKDAFTGSGESKDPGKDLKGSDEALRQYTDVEYNALIEIDSVRRPEPAQFPSIFVESRWEVDIIEKGSGQSRQAVQSS